MAKQILLNVLQDVLGDFVEGLESENLKLGVFSGKISLEHLKIKTEALQNLSLPIEVRHGSLKKLGLLKMMEF